MDGGDSSRNARQSLNRFRYPGAQHARVQYGTRKGFGSQGAGSSQPSWSSQRDRVDVSDNEIALVQDDVPLDAFDRELLAELEQESQEVSSKKSKPYTLRAPLYATPGARPSGIFRSSVAMATPGISLRGLASSPSESEPLDSPLNGVKNRMISRVDRREVTSPHWPSTAAASFPNTPCPPGGALGLHIESPAIQLKHAPPTIQGIQLVSTHELPDRFRSIFPFSIFNAIQSKCFNPIYRKDDNFVLSAPTGSGKTVIMELAICRLISTIKDSRFKVVYQAPTKSLCSERFRDWRAKFATLDLQCAELTGDTDQAQLRNVQHASIIITTPEKWDSMTRKWKDHSRLMQLVKLFLIDEVHILKESRGATLEAVVSRMKSVDSNVRFVALSATVPNSEDIAAWLGRDPTNQHLPAHRERFGEEFRPVKLQKFVYGYQFNGNDFAFDKMCDAKLPEVISKHSQRKPIMIFCCTRNSAIATSKNLAKLWTTTNAPHRLWKGPKKPIIVQNQDLKTTVSAGVAFHHAGLDAADRHTVESAYLDGHINVICCTSTLAVGVNLPCHLVIIKNTASWQDNCCKEYADLEMMQMLGRAGRPQFDNSAIAVILTRKERVDFYQKLVAGSEPLESCLHLNLIDHLNAEIGLGTVTDLESATRWLSGTFFFTRLQKNPTHYKLKEGSNRTDEEERMSEICAKDIQLLQECSLITLLEPLKSTEFGDAMARYYVKFETMRLFLALPPKAKMSEILSAIAQADEFREIRLKAGEKSLYKELNKATGIKFPIKVDIGLAAHKISLLIQSELGGVEVPTGEQYQKHRLTFQQDKSLVFSHVNRLIRCIIDCQISRGDSVSARHALELARSFGAKVWDSSPLQMKQIEQIGIVAVRKLANCGIHSIEELEATDAHRIDTILSKNPPFGMKLLGRLADFPKLRVSVKMVGKETKPGKWPVIQFKAEVGFLNEKVPTFFQRKPVYVCFLAETSDGRIVDFRRVSANKMQNGHDVGLKAELTHSYQHITCYVMCDDIAGTLRQAELKPKLPESQFSGIRPSKAGSVVPSKLETNDSQSRLHRSTVSSRDSNEFSDDCFNDDDFIAAVDSLNAPGGKNIAGELKSNALKKVSKSLSDPAPRSESEGPTQLDNGKWACNHRCKDKTACKHFCCREGLDRPPKGYQKQGSKEEAGSVTNVQKVEPTSAKITAQSSKLDTSQKVTAKIEKNSHDEIDVIDLTGPVITVKSTPRYKYVKKRNEKEDEPRKPAPSTKKQTAIVKAVKVDNTGSPDCLSFPEFTSGDGIKNDVNHSSDFGSIDIDDLFSPETIFNPNTVDRNNQVMMPVHPTPIDDFDYDDIIDVDIGNTAPTHESFEDDLTDYEQYITSLDEPSLTAFNQAETNSSTRFLNADGAVSQQGSPLKSTLDPTVFSPVAGGPLPTKTSLSSDSLFFQSPVHPKATKRSRDEDGEDQDLAMSDAKQLRLDASDPSGTVPGWEGIDLALIEEFKDVADFF